MTAAEFLARFGHFVDAPDGVQRLRELILQLAVRGELVHRDSNDETASGLLERIRREKQNLIDEGHIKFSKLVPPLNSCPGFFDLPVGWQWAYLADIVALISDGDHQAPPKAEQGIPFLVIGNLNTGHIKFSECRYVPNDYYENLDWGRRPQIGDILYTVTGSYGIAIPVQTDAPFCVQRHVAIFKKVASTPTPYLLHFLRSPVAGNYAANAATGIAQKTVSLTSLRQMPVPLPPLAEQHRIVAKVDELMALCDRLEAERKLRNETHTRLIRAVHHPLTEASDAASTATAWRRIRHNFAGLYTTRESVQALRQTILELAVQGKLVPQDPTDERAEETLESIRAKRAELVLAGLIKKQKTIPSTTTSQAAPFGERGWTWAPFDELVEVAGGVTKGRKLHGRMTGRYPYLRVANVQRGKLDLSTIREIEIPLEELERYRLRTGDLLITEGGDWDKVGRTAIWSGEIDNCLHQNHVFRARLFHSLTDKCYLMLYLNSPVSREYFAKAAKQTTNLASINMTQLRAAPIPLPPLAEQHRIVAKVDQLMGLCDQLEAAIMSRDETARRYAEAVVHKLSAA